MSDSIEISPEKYQRLLDHRSQVVGENWINVLRTDDEHVRARPVERQDGRSEGERVTSDEWLIEDVNGETYTVTEETFTEMYDSFETKTVFMDLSVDPIEHEDEPDIGGTEVIVEATAYIDVAYDTVEHLSVDRVMYAGQEMDGVPTEVFKDHPDVSTTEEDNE